MKRFNVIVVWTVCYKLFQACRRLLSTVSKTVEGSLLFLLNNKVCHVLLPFSLASAEIWHQQLRRDEQKWEIVPDQGTSVRKGTVPLEFLASDQNGKDTWMSRWAERPGGRAQLKKTSKIRRRRIQADITTDRSYLVLHPISHRKPELKTAHKAGWTRFLVAVSIITNFCC